MTERQASVAAELTMDARKWKLAGWQEEMLEEQWLQNKQKMDMQLRMFSCKSEKFLDLHGRVTSQYGF